jgi:hypothetical protein
MLRLATGALIPEVCWKWNTASLWWRRNGPCHCWCIVEEVLGRPPGCLRVLRVVWHMTPCVYEGGSQCFRGITSFKLQAAHTQWRDILCQKKGLRFLLQVVAPAGQQLTAKCTNVMFFPLRPVCEADSVNLSSTAIQNYNADYSYNSCNSEIKTSGGQHPQFPFESTSLQAYCTNYWWQYCSSLILPSCQ